MVKTARHAGAEDVPGPGRSRFPTEAATERLARFLADELQPGDSSRLSGGLGAGKTTLARALVRIFAGDPDLEVPSPTFTLMQVYDTPRGPVVHAGFLPHRRRDELRGARLGGDRPRTRSSLVEWPERAEAALKPDRLDIASILRPDGAGGAHRAPDRLRRLRAAARAREGLPAPRRAARLGDATRVPMQGDASTRAYERLVKPDGETAILMISPPRPDGRRCGAASPTAPSRSSPRASTPSWRSTAACGRSASARRASTARISRPASSSSRISAPSPWSTPTGRSPSATRGDAAPRPAARPIACRTCCPCRGPRARAPALRSRRLPDRGRAPARLVRAAHRRHAPLGLGRAEFVNLWTEAPRRGPGRPDHLDPARLPLAEPDLARRARRPRARRPDRLPGRGARPSGLRRRLPPAGCARDRAGPSSS